MMPNLYSILTIYAGYGFKFGALTFLIIDSIMMLSMLQILSDEMSLILGLATDNATIRFVTDNSGPWICIGSSFPRLG